MNNVVHKKNYLGVAVQICVEPPPVSFIKVRIIQKWNRIVWKFELCRDPTSKSQSCMNFKWHFLVTAKRRSSSYFCGTLRVVEVSGTLVSNANLHILRGIIRGEALHKFDALCDQVGSTTMAHLNQVILVLGTHFYHVNVLSDKNTWYAIEWVSRTS